MIELLQKIITKGKGRDKFRNERSLSISKNVILAFISKGGSIIIGLVLVPMTIDYINSTLYGVWLTVSSVANWMAFFDFGIGHGLRNKLTECMANEDYEKAKKYVSTTYIIMAFIGVILLIFILVLNPLINWNNIFNIPVEIEENIQLVMLIVLGGVCVQFVVQLLNTVLTATHRTGIVSFIGFLIQLIILLFVFVLKYTTTGSLYKLVLVLSLTPIVVYCILNIVFYSKKLRVIRPSLSYIDFKFSKDVLNLGGSFLFLQLGALGLFQSSNIIIANVISQDAVTEYNITYKLISVPLLIFTIMVTPYWSAFTDAYTKGDFLWMKKSTRRINIIWLGVCILTIVIILLSQQLFDLWVKERVRNSWALTASVGVYCMIYMKHFMYAYILNGVGKLRIQMILLIMGVVVHIPLSIYLAKSFGTVGLVISYIFVYLVISLIERYQTYLIIHNQSTGIWNK